MIVVLTISNARLFVIIGRIYTNICRIKKEKVTEKLVTFLISLRLIYRVREE